MTNAMPTPRRTQPVSSARWFLLLVCATPFYGFAQAPAVPAAHTQDSGRVPLDGIVAVVNNDLILESDVDAEQRFAAFEPLRPEGPETRQQIINHLIDRDLILQQMAVQPPPPISDQALDAQIAELRKTIPQCAQYHCETDAGWQKFCEAQGFTPQEVRERWRRRMEILAFIEQRFRFGIQITPQEIDTYYNTKLLPAYQKRHATPPPESSIQDRIQEVLLQQQVTALLDDWIKALRAEGGVRILDQSSSSPDQDHPDQNNP